MNAVRDDVGGDAGIGEHGGDDAGIAMRERAHGIEGVGGVASAGSDGALGEGEIGVGMSEADADSAGDGGGDHLEGAIEFGSDGEHADAASGGLPEALERFDARREEMLGRMDSATHMADERTFEVNADRGGANGERPGVCGDLKRGFIRIRFRRVDGIGQTFERVQRAVDGSGNGGREISRDSMAREQALDRRQSFGRIVHHVVAGAAVDVEIQVTGREVVFAQIHERNLRWERAAYLRGNFNDASLVDEQQGTGNRGGRSQQACSGKGQHRKYEYKRITREYGLWEVHDDLWSLDARSREAAESRLGAGGGGDECGRGLCAVEAGLSAVGGDGDRRVDEAPNVILFGFQSPRRPVVAIVCKSVGEWLSLVEHLVRDQGVGGSNPLSPTNLFKHISSTSGFSSTAV